MAVERVLAGLEVSVVERRRVVDVGVLADYWALTKPEINFLILVTTFAGFYLGCVSESRELPFVSLVNALLGTMLVASGAGTLNQYIERRFDAQMRRTSRRPLAAGRLNPSAVLWFGVTLSAIGGIYLAVTVNWLASLLAVFTLLSYLFFYTPIKRKTPLCTFVGAIPGAVPPLIGWAAASGKLPVEAWVLFGIIFFWQFPHFMAIAWMYRDDYERAGYMVLPRRRAGNFAILQTLVPLSFLIPISLVPVISGRLGPLYFIGASLLSITFFYYGVQFAIRRSIPAARRLLAASILYLPLLFALVTIPGSSSVHNGLWMTACSRGITPPLRGGMAATSIKYREASVVERTGW